MNSRIKKIREINKLSQSKFAELLGTTRNAIANIENGRTEASGTMRELICLKFHINKKWLETGEGDMNESNKGLDYKITKLYNDLSDEHKMIVRNFVVNMLENVLEVSDNKIPEYDEYTAGELEDFQAEEKKHSEDVG